jgi:hypothetical protein
MSNDGMQTAERAVAEFRREIALMTSDTIDLLSVERRAQELTNAVGRVLMREAMARADASAPEIKMDGEDWGNRRVGYVHGGVRRHRAAARHVPTLGSRPCCHPS